MVPMWTIMLGLDWSRKGIRGENLISKTHGIQHIRQLKRIGGRTENRQPLHTGACGVAWTERPGVRESPGTFTLVLRSTLDFKIHSRRGEMEGIRVLLDSNKTLKTKRLREKRKMKSRMKVRTGGRKVNYIKKVLSSVAELERNTNLRPKCGVSLDRDKVPTHRQRYAAENEIMKTMAR